MPAPRDKECTTCHRRFRTAQSLSQHIASNPHPVYSCSQCSRTFGNERALQQHVSDSPFHGGHDCVECDRSFQSAQALAQHLSDSLAHQPVEEDEETLLGQLWELQRVYEERAHMRELREPGFLEAIERVQNPTPISRYLVGFEPTGFPLGWDDNDMDSSSDGATEVLGDLSYDNEEARRLVPRSIIGTPPLLPSASSPTSTHDLSRSAGAPNSQMPGPNLDSDPLALAGPVQTPRPQDALLGACGIIDAEYNDAEPLTLEAQLTAERNKNKALEQELRELREALKLEKLIRQCGMCYEKTTDTVTKCGHLFCSGCVVSWQEQHYPPFSAPCPMCRSPMGKARRVFRE